jgi:hypothetical protein
MATLNPPVSPPEELGRHPEPDHDAGALSAIIAAGAGFVAERCSSGRCRTREHIDRRYTVGSPRCQELRRAAPSRRRGRRPARTPSPRR